MKASICQQIKLSAAYLKGGGMNTGILNSEFGHASLIFGGIKLRLSYYYNKNVNATTNLRLRLVLKRVFIVFDDDEGERLLF